MQQPETSFLDWVARFSTEAACLEAIIQQRWPTGFLCPHCGHDHAYILTRGHKYQCARCRTQVSPTAGTIFHHSHVPLTQWFVAIFLMTTDKGGISALRLAKMIGVSWPTAWRMLRCLRRAMADRDSVYRLSGLIEVDDALIGGRRSGKAGRGAEGKTPVILAVENHGQAAGFAAAEVCTDGLNKAAVRGFARRHVHHAATARSDALHALRCLGEQHTHEARVTPAEQATEWLPKVHLIIANLKRFVLGTFHGVSARFLAEYVAEFLFRFNRRHWESQLPYRLLEAAVSHTPFQPKLRKV